MSQILTIEKVVHGGCGLARGMHGAVLVPGALPGEVVDASEVGKRNGMPVMAIDSLREQSVDRREPACAHFGECGGCDWLFIHYERQLALKREIFIESLERIGRLSDFPGPATVAAHEYGYRCRAQLKFDRKTRSAGFFRRRSNDVVAVRQCPLLSERLNSLLEKIHEQPEIVPETVHNIRVVDGDAAVASDPVLVPFTGPSTEISCGTARFSLRGDDFFQSNRYCLKKLADCVRYPGGGGFLVDLYGGTGFFSVMLSDTFEKTLLIETDHRMVSRAKKNFRNNGVRNGNCMAAPAEEMERFVPRPPDLLVVDPPRPGLTRRVRETVAKLKPGTIAYVSCNCATQARDCGYLVNRAGYSLEATWLIDLYPNTHHTETVVILKK